MTSIIYRWMAPDEVVRVAEIDRTERVRIGFKYKGGQLLKMDVNWDTPDFTPEGDGEHSVAAQIKFCNDHLNAGGSMLGAFQGENLVGIGVLRPEIRKGMAQLANLQVGNGYRRMGIGSYIIEQLIWRAKETGANSLYVSATPSGSAVGFYLSHGFEPVKQPIQELFELEPEDIHLIKVFRKFNRRLY